MNSEQQQKEYIITEEQLSDLVMFTGQYGQFEAGMSMGKIIRSRPHTSAPAPILKAFRFEKDGLHFIPQNGCEQIISLQEHDAAIRAEAAKSAREQIQQRFDVLEELRNLGWMVAIHNDYWQDGKYYTFWLMTSRDGKYLKGESSMEHGGDVGALNQIKESLRHQHESTAAKGE